MNLPFMEKVRVAASLIPFLGFSCLYEKNLKAKADAEGLTLEEYKKKHYTLDNSDGKYSKQLSMIK